MNEPCYYRVSVKGIVIDDQGRILLARESDGTWDMLGGGLDHGEDPKACLRREFHEETGLTVTSISDAPTYFVTAAKPHGDTTVYIANVIYTVTLANLDFTPSDECQELRFFSASDLAGLKLPPNMHALRALLTS